MTCFRMAPLFSLVSMVQIRILKPIPALIVWREQCVLTIWINAILLCNVCPVPTVLDRSSHLSTIHLHQEGPYCHCSAETPYQVLQDTMWVLYLTYCTCSNLAATVHCQLWWKKDENGSLSDCRRHFTSWLNEKSRSPLWATIEWDWIGLYGSYFDDELEGKWLSTSKQIHYWQDNWFQLLSGPIKATFGKLKCSCSMPADAPVDLTLQALWLFPIHNWSIQTTCNLSSWIQSWVDCQTLQNNTLQYSSNLQVQVCTVQYSTSTKPQIISL